MPNIDLSILNQRQTPAFYADTLANRPAAGFVGRIFVSTNTFAFYRDNGTGWDLIGGPGTGTITGSGATGQIALWDGASTITGDTGLTYNGTDNSLTASKFIVTGGTSSQFLKADGSLDSSAYLTTNIYNGNGTLSAERTVSLNNFNLIFDGGATTARVRLDADTNVARIFSFATNNLPRFAIRVDGTESGGNTGSDYAIRRYDDSGTFVDAPLTITRSTGQSTFAKKVVIENNAGDQQLQIVSTTAPSLRFDNLQTGATKRAGFGISTATNNFIQGSADRDFCMFNGSTTASPILFGIYDTTNVQEAARISAARNFLIGTTTDGGQKLQISGSARATSYYLDGMTAGSGALYYSGTRLTLANYNASGTLLFEVNGGAAAFSIDANRISTFVSTGGNGLRVYGGSGTNQWDMYLSGANLRIGDNTGGGNLQIDSNVTINTSLSPFGSQVNALQMPQGVCLYAWNASAVPQLYLGANNYFDGSNFKYIISGQAVSLYYQANGSHIWYNAGSGTAGNNISLSQPMTLAATGNLLIGTTTDAGYKLQVNGSAQATRFTSNETTINMPDNTATTIFTGQSGVFLVSIQVIGNGSQVGYAICGFRGASPTLYVLSSGTGNQLSFSVSGTNLQATQTAGVALDARVSYISLVTPG
jgi:hypothetical protein